MLSHILVLISSCALILGQSDEDLPFLPETVFGDKTFLPEVVPQSVQRSLTEDGELRIAVNVLYSEDSIIGWVAHGSRSSYIERIYLRVTGTVPSEYTLQIFIPRKIIQNSDIFPVAENSSGQTASEVFKLEYDDFLVDYKELYFKFQTVNLPEAAVLKISLDIDNAEDNSQDNKESIDSEGDAGVSVIDEALPKFPEMKEMEVERNIVTPGRRTQVLLDVLFTENDRFSVRGLLYNSSSNRIFTTLWSTSYLLGPSDFRKIQNGRDEGNKNLDDNVKLLENFDSQELPSLRQILIDIPTENDDVSGIYTITAHHEASIEDSGYILESSLQQVFIVQRASDEHGPIPPGVLEFEGGPYSQVSCRIGLTCLVSCRVFGVGVQTLQLMHKDAESKFVTLPREDVDYGPYESVVIALVDSTKPASSGTYLCQADSGPISINKEIDVNFVEM